MTYAIVGGNEVYHEGDPVPSKFDWLDIEVPLIYPKGMEPEGYVGLESRVDFPVGSSLASALVDPHCHDDTRDDIRTVHNRLKRLHQHALGWLESQKPYVYYDNHLEE